MKFKSYKGNLYNYSQITIHKNTMATDQIVLYKNIDVANITFSAPKNLDSGARMISIYHNSKPLIMQIPSLDAVYGITRWSNEKGPDKLNLDLSFGQYSDFLSLIKSIDNKFLDDGLSNAQTWFKKKLASREIVEALYSPLVKYPKDKLTGEITDKYPPTMRFTIPVTREGKVNCEIYNNECKKVELDSIELKRAKVAAIVHFSGIWIAGGKYGCTVKILQMKVNPSVNYFSKYAFVNDPDDE